MQCSGRVRVKGGRSRAYIMMSVEQASPEALTARTSVVSGMRARVLGPRLIVGLLLIAGGVMWAIARGLEFYGVGPVNIAYDLDQPPLLLIVVGGWILYRSRRR